MLLAVLRSVSARGWSAPKRLFSTTSWASRKSEKISEEESYARLRREQLSKSSFPSSYPHKFPVSHHLREVSERWSHLKPSEAASEKESMCVAGRVWRVRAMGKKLFFLDVESERGDKLQIKAHAASYEEGKFFSEIPLLNCGDVIGVRGIPSRTKSGELSLTALRVQLLAPCLRFLPSTEPGSVNLDDVETRFRRRHLDFLVNAASRDVIRTRSKIISAVRRFYDERNFLEVETPVLQTKAGGATAAPFNTKLNALDMPMCLRIAPELHLKRLLVGGFDRVYEIGRQFRNEGMDPTHNPEFTTVESYAAYADYNDVMDMAEKMLGQIVGDLFGPELKVPYTMKDRPVVLDFKAPFNRYEYLQCLESALGKELPGPVEIHEDSEDTRAFLVDICKNEGVDCAKAGTAGKLLDKLFGHAVEPELVHPTFILHHPCSLSPLAKPHRNTDTHPFLSERFELFVGGSELANAYSELNDPSLQREAFLRGRGEGDGDHEDLDFVEALEYGMPPAGGFGMGIDRLTMILTNQRSIKEVLCFPTMKPKK